MKEGTIGSVTIGNDYILMPSDRDGYTGIYLYNMNGTQLRHVGGRFDITDIYGYDEKTGDIYYQAAAINPHDRQIYVAHKNGKIERLSDKEGCNYAIFSGDYRYFINTWSDYNTPYVYTTRDNQGRVLSTNLDNKELKAKIAEYGWTQKEAFSFTTSEGALFQIFGTHNLVENSKIDCPFRCGRGTIEYNEEIINKLDEKVIEMYLKAEVIINDL